jgi:GNAT superfamily N-acetyltransferase
VRVISLGFRTDLAVRRLEGAELSDRGGYLVVRSPDNPDFWWGNFLLLPSPHGPGTAGAWLARFVAEFPAAGHVTLGVDGTDDPGPVPADFRAAGLEPALATVLTATAVRPPRHRTVTAQIRPLTSDADWQQSLDLGVRCFGPDGDQDFLVRRATAKQRLTRAGHGAWFGAFAGGRLLAQLGVCDAGHGLARYQDVETDPAARRQGLAGTLLWHAGRYARDVLGARTLVIVADPAGEAIRLYRSGGLAPVQHQLTLERPAPEVPPPVPAAPPPVPAAPLPAE